MYNFIKNYGKSLKFNHLPPPPQKPCQTKNVMYKFLRIFLAGWLLFACSGEKEVEKEVPQEKPNDKDKTTQLIEKQKVSGFVQKGPFVSGSTLTANELENDLSQTGKTFTAVLKNNEGAFDLKNIKLKSPYVQLSVDGFFFNEIAGKISTSKITLYAVSNVKDRSSVNVNLLTHLQKPRVEKLIEQGKTFAEAKAQSLLEIGKSFYLTDKDLKGINPEDIQLTGKDAASLMLLAASSIVLEGKTEGELTQFLTQYSDDLADNGVIDKKEIQESIRESSYRLHLWDKNHKRLIDYIAENVVAYYKKMGKTVTLGDFGKYIDHNKNGDLGDYKSLKPTLSFQGMVRSLSGGKKISTQEILKQLGGQGKAGYTIKTIELSGLNGTFAKVTGTKPNLGLELLKTGEFKATITLEHPKFEGITKVLAIKVVAQKFIFNKLTRQIYGVISTEQILNQIPNAKKLGYKLKSIVLADKSFATVSGTAPNLKMDLKKMGRFTATIILSHPTYFDVTLANCEFEIMPPKFTFNKLTRRSDGGKVISTEQILNQIPNAKKLGYQLKSIKLSDNSLATVSGTAPNLKLDLKKTGNFTATIILSHPTYFDVTVANCDFEIMPPKFTFNKLTRRSDGGKVISTEQILAQIPNAKAKGYQLKSVVVSDGSFATVSGTAPNLKLDLKKTGNFTATIVLENPKYFDVTVANCDFEIILPTFSFQKLTRRSDGGNVISTEQILAQIPDAKNRGYQLKSIVLADKSFATVNGAAPDSELELKKVGNFTATIVLQKPKYFDVTVANCDFEIILPFFSFNNYSRNSDWTGVITTAQILAQIPDAKSKGYQLKNIVLSDTQVANITGIAPNLKIDLKKKGYFTATIILAHPKYFDVKIENCAFDNYILKLDSAGVLNIKSKVDINSLKTVIIPSVILGQKVTTIDDYAFYGSSLTSVTIGNSVTTIGRSAFYSCSSLTSVTIGNSVTTIGEQAFNDCNSLTSVTIPNSVTTIGDYAFSSCSKLTSVTIPDSVKTIGSGAFNFCSKLISVTIPDSVTTIESYTFNRCSSLTSVTIPDSVTTIERQAFKGCSSLTSVTIPDPVTTIGNDAFGSCQKLVVTIEQTDPSKIILKLNPRTTKADAFDSVKQIKVLQSSLAKYQKADRWKNWASKMAGY